MPDIKVSVSDETLEFLQEEFPDGLSDPERVRTAVNVIRFIRNNNIEGLKQYLSQEGLGDLDMEEMMIEGMKRALLESDDFDLSDLSTLTDTDSTDE